MPQLATFMGDESHVADEVLHAELTRMRTSAPVPPPHPSGPNAMHVHNHLARMDPLLPRHWCVWCGVVWCGVVWCGVSVGC